MSRREEFETGKSNRPGEVIGAPKWWHHPTTPEMIDEMKWEQGKSIEAPKDHTTNKDDTPPF
jgi:hypothetical protein